MPSPRGRARTVMHPQRAHGLSLEEGYVISAVVVSEEAFERGPLSLSAFARNVRHEGMEIAA